MLFNGEWNNCIIGKCDASPTFLKETELLNKENELADNGADGTIFVFGFESVERSVWSEL